MWAGALFVAAVAAIFGGRLAWVAVRARRYRQTSEEEHARTWRALGGPVTAPFVRWFTTRRTHRD
jgi:hypothetical protein